MSSCAFAELRTAAKGTVAIHRFRTRDKVESFWLVNGQEATPPAMRLPLETIADELRVSKETARSQLKSVFQKTGVRRQAELVGLLASFLNARQ